MTQSTEQEMPLIEAALLLGQSYERTMRQVLCGELHGRRDAGKWRVTVRSVERMRSERESARVPAA